LRPAVAAGILRGVEFENEDEYRQAVEKLREEREKLSARREQLEKMGLSPDQIDRAIAPLVGFQQRLAERVARHERESAPDLRTLGAHLADLAESRAGQGDDPGIDARRLEALRRGEVTLAEAASIADALAVDLRVSVLPRPPAT
jgi:hypothetical protein